MSWTFGVVCGAWRLLRAKRRRPAVLITQPRSLAWRRSSPWIISSLRSADAQKQLLDDTVKAYTDNLQLTTNRFEGGVAPRADVAQAKHSWTHARSGHRCHCATSAV